MTDQEKNMTMGTQQVRRLTRRADNKMIAGVAGGLGHYFGVDPIWFRLGFVVTSFMGGVGILAYIVLLLIMPDSTASAVSPAERAMERAARTLRFTPTWIGIALVVLGGILVLSAAVDWRPGVVWGFALIIFGVLLFIQRGQAVAIDESEPAPVTEVLEPPAPVSSTAAASAVPAEAVPPRPPRVRERSTLGYLTFGTLLVALGTLILLDMQGAITLSAGQYLALALGVIGLGLLVGSVIGRARWLIVPGIVLVPFVFAASLIHVPFEGGFGQRTYSLTGVPQAFTEYHMIAGEMTIDLRGLTPSTPFTIEATAVAGRILVIVPPNASVDVEAKVGGGRIDLFGQHDEGMNVDVHRTFGAAPGAPTIELDLEAGFGQLEVRS